MKNKNMTDYDFISILAGLSIIIWPFLIMTIWSVLGHGILPLRTLLMKRLAYSLKLTFSIGQSLLTFKNLGEIDRNVVTGIYKGMTIKIYDKYHLEQRSGRFGLPTIPQQRKTVITVNEKIFSKPRVEKNSSTFLKYIADIFCLRLWHTDQRNNSNRIANENVSYWLTSTKKIRNILDDFTGVN